MRVLMLTQFYPPVIGGEERHVKALSEALVGRGHEVHVATMPHPSRPKTEVVGGVTVHSINGFFQRASFLFSELERPHAPPFPDPELAFRLLRLAQEVRPDIIHGHNWLIHSYFPWVARRGAAVVSTLHDHGLSCAIKTLVRKGTRCDGPELAKCLRCAGDHYGRAMGAVTAVGHLAAKSIHHRFVDHFIAVSQAVADTCSLSGGTVPYDVLPTFLPDDIDRLSPSTDPRIEQLPPDGFLLFVGELNHRKGLGTLIEAYSRLIDAPPLILIGRRCPDTPRTLPRNVTLHESWPHEAVMHAWRRCSFGLAPSNWIEPCATVVMEANAFGKPVIATNHGGFPGLVDQGRSGLLVPPDNPGELAQAIQTLNSNGALRASLSKGALQKVQSFKASAVVPRIEAVYHKALASRAKMPVEIAPQPRWSGAER
jgi:glycosyltransferase involved in cell wall biosynthesis